MSDPAPAKPPRRRRTSLTTRIFIAIGLGIFAGVFFGELIAPLQIVGDVFIQLLQMTVLPYVTVSLVTGLGRLHYSEAGSIAKAGGLTLLLLWGLAMIMVLIMPLAFPEWESASFFSTSLVGKTESFDFLGLYIPANPFASLANSLVPAVVLFSLTLGAALIGVRNKQTLIDALSTISDALMRVAGFVVELTPIGVFAIAASAAGTIGVDELARLQIYVVLFVGSALLLTFWVLPGLIVSFTPVRYRELLVATRAALITAFATGSVFVVVPVIADRVKHLVGEHVRSKEDGDSLVDVVVPTVYSFPSSGTLLALSFVLFAGWFTGSPVALSSYPVFVVSGLFSSFGGSNVAIPFMLDQMRVSADMFQLFLVLNQVINSRFGMLLAAMHICVLTLLTAFAIFGQLRFSWAKALRFVAITVVASVVFFFGVRVVYTNFVGHEYKQYRVFVAMEIQGPSVPVTHVLDPPPPGPPAQDGLSALDRIEARGSLRVGYFRDRLPYAFVNESNQLVGFDAEMAHDLAGSLGVTVEFVRVEPADMPSYLNSGYLDIVMSGLIMTMETSRNLQLSSPYADATLAFIVPDHRREEFSSRESVQRLKNLRVGSMNLPSFLKGLADYLPNAEVVPLESPREFFRGDVEDLDAMLLSAETGSAWSLIYPDFTVAIPVPDVIAVPVVYAMAPGDEQMSDFIDDWLELTRRDGTLKRLYDYWILGKDAEKRKPRWSIARDVLGWVD